MPEYKEGTIKSIAGPLVIGKGMKGCEMYEVVRIGDEGLMGETIRLTVTRHTFSHMKIPQALSRGGRSSVPESRCVLSWVPGLLKTFMMVSRDRFLE